MPCPLIGGAFCSLDIRRANFYAVQTNSHMRTMLYQECKAYVCLEVFENEFLVQQASFVNCDVNSIFFIASLKESGYLL